MRIVVVGLIFLLGCGDEPASPIDAMTVDSLIDGEPTVIDGATPDSMAPGMFTLTSSAYAEGGVIPGPHSCNGANISPSLAWTGAPAGTQSFAIVLTDKTNLLIHSAIYDIPASVTALAEDVDKAYAPADVPGAHQPVAYSGVRGYAGPCPTGSTHTYEQKIYALATATVPNATMGTTRAQLVTTLATNLGTATLTATYTP